MLLRRLLVFALTAASLAAAETPPGRVRFTINDEWRFAGGDVTGAERPEHDDASWETLDLPHTWNAHDAFDDTAGYRRGVGWYRRHLHLDPALRSKRLFLFFEGVNQVADVWVNGKRAGRHVGGYTAFVFDVTDLVAFDARNVIAVRADNAHDPDIPPLNGDFTFYGGIYRDVWLIATDPVHVTVTDHASPGVFIQTPRVDAEAATVRAFGTVNNASDAPARVRIVHRVIDPDGALVGERDTRLDIPAGAARRFDVMLPPVARPRLWSPATPDLYRVATEVYRGGVLTDRVENPLGFRWFSVDSRAGFFLNGEKVTLAGTNRHQDHSGYGNALSDLLHRRDVEIVKENGFNFLRLAHYPQDPAVLAEADRLGLVIWEEIPIVNLIGMSDAFAENSERMLVEMIRQHYNHPSVFFWGYMNEVMLTKPDPVPGGYYERIHQLATRLERRAHEEDPYRKTVMALSRDEVPPKDHGVGAIADVLGLNLYFGWYYERLGSLGAFLDDFHAAYPDRPLIVSEYGAGSDERVHSKDPVAFDFSSEYAQIFHRESFPQIEARPYLVGSAVWNQFDFGSEFRNDSKPALNQKGLYFFDREPKDTAFYYRAALTDEPVLRIAREWGIRAVSRPEYRGERIWAYTNLEDPTFFINGKGTGVLPVINRTVQADAVLQDGVNEIRIVARRGDTWLTDVAFIRFQDRSLERASGTVVAVNAGSVDAFVDPAGVVWEPDRRWQGSGWGHRGGNHGGTHHRIARTADDPLFQSSREGMESYRFDVPDGLYEVELVFAERERAAVAGDRVFTVRVNGQPFADRLDLAAAPGALTALRRKGLVRAEGGGGIVISFSAAKGKPTVSGILIRR